jgi:glutathione S-transferase
MSRSGLILYGSGRSTRALKVELVASFADVELEKVPFTMGITNKTPRYLAMNPLAKVLLTLT